MKVVLLSGVLLNTAGAGKLVASALASARSAAELPGDYLQIMFFTAGTSMVFASLYAYLYVHPRNVIPFLVFGAALKTWAFLASLGLFAADRLSRRLLIEFGVSNLVVAVLFWGYIVTRI